MKALTYILTILCLIPFLQGCYYDIEEELYPGSVCDSTNVTYSGTIVPILTANCYVGCHASGVSIGGITMEGYTNVKISVDNGRLLKSIKHESGVSSMPKSANKLSACSIAKIEKWIINGAPNN